MDKKDKKARKIIFLVISILAQIIASPPLTVPDAGVIVKETGRPQLEQNFALGWQNSRKRETFQVGSFNCKIP